MRPLSSFTSISTKSPSLACVAAATGSYFATLASGQYDFLRKEYPGSRYRVEGQFTVGQIYADDLDDAPAARAAFEQFLKEHPQHRLSADARKALADLDADAAARKKGVKIPMGS